MILRLSLQILDVLGAGDTLLKIAVIICRYLGSSLDFNETLVGKRPAVAQFQLMVCNQHVASFGQSLKLPIFGHPNLFHFQKST
jgi:hypothetical protein